MRQTTKAIAFGILLICMSATIQGATTLTAEKIARTQQQLVTLGLSGWLIYDFHGYNKVAVDYLGLSGVITRRSFYFIPASGEAVAFVSAIEEDKFKDLPGRKVVFLGYKMMEAELSKYLNSVLPAGASVAMEYSPSGRLPYIGYVDAGTIELVRAWGYTPVSSADLVANLSAALSPERRALHLDAARKVIAIKDEAFDYIRTKLRSREALKEYDVCEFIMRRFEEEGMVADHYPIVAVNGAAGDPHYEPMPESSNPIAYGDLILIDMWARQDRPDGVYGDITWMAYANQPGDTSAPQKLRDIFDVVLRGQQAAFDYLTANWKSGPIYGAQADDSCRKVITDAGYGAKFTHRTGHSITHDVHGSGPNIDNLETEDRRRIIPGHVFSIEPGIYAPSENYGFRSEINVMMTESGPMITTTPRQSELTVLFPGGK